MPMLTTDDGVRLHYEEAGSGAPIVFVHEFAGDARSWEPQMRYFSRRYRCVAYCARGYTPSDVPEDFERYSRANAQAIREKGMQHFADTYGRGPARVQLQKKDPRGFDEYLHQLAAHSVVGSANTILGVQSRRPSFYDMTAEIAKLQVPLLIL